MRRALTILAAIALGGVIAGVSAQQPLFSRAILQQVDLSVPGHEVVTAVAEIKPGGSPGWHTHPGEEVGYVLEGTVVIEQAGKPDMTAGPGKAFVIPAGTVHNATNHSTAVVKILANYVVEKGKPVATPAAAPAKK
jgi:quercetin dioxygenase-like cupin family protein